MNDYITSREWRQDMEDGTMASRRNKRLTYKKADRALLAIVELIECRDATPLQKQELNGAANLVREIRDACPQ